VFDVAVTGDPRYGAGAGKVEQVAPTVGKKVSLPGGPGVSPWVELSSRGDPETPPVPALAPAGDGRGFVAAYERARAGGVEVASFTAGPGGVAGPSRVQAVSGWSLVGDPVLFPAAGGGLQMLFQGIRSTNPGDPLDGTILVRRNDDGSFGNPVLASSSYRGLGSEAVLASDLTTPIFSTTQSGLVVNYGGSNATAIDLSRYSQGAPYGSAIAYDNTRRLWLAWYADGGSTPARAGLYMLQLDPATGEPVSGVSAAHAPASANVNFAERLALACASSCRLVYEDGTRLLSWAPGESSPATVAYGVNVLSSPAAAYTSDGRLWVVWVDGSVLYAKLGDARGVRGLTAQLGSPPGGSQPRESAIVPAGNALVVATAWSTGTQTVWAATVRR
jgi:hypothetical protein